jgi:hypothetical protein
MESMWMLAGDCDIEFPTFFNSTYGQYSDDGRTMWDAYGWRWKRFFGWDQLEGIIAELRANPTSRRCVLSMWNSAKTGTEEPWTKGMQMFPLDSDDFYAATHGGKAVPCNVVAMFAVKAGRLSMTVVNRSNDLFFGMLGANVVHFSLLLEYLSMRIGVPMGSWFQFTVNMHAYTEKFSRTRMELIVHECDTVGVLPACGPVIEAGFDDDLKLFMTWARWVIRVGDPALKTNVALDVPDLKTAFFIDVAVPMFLFWTYRKWKDEYSSNICLDGIEAPDWQRACREWAERRAK